MFHLERASVSHGAWRGGTGSDPSLPRAGTDWPGHRDAKAEAPLRGRREHSVRRAQRSVSADEEDGEALRRCHGTRVHERCKRKGGGVQTRKETGKRKAREKSARSRKTKVAAGVAWRGGAT